MHLATMMTKVFFALLAALACCGIAASTEDIIQTTNGPVQGLTSGNMTAYLGIPYASAGRWEIPEDPSPWVEPFQANQYGDICPQTNSSAATLAATAALEETGFDQPWNVVLGPPTTQSEDCLKINVYSPVGATKTPVMVYLHGGGLNTGNGNGFDYYSDPLLDKDVILVTFNYRLGRLGYFAHPDLDATNFGLRDQIKALEWVRENIANFGGDPDHVTIFGQSAGGGSVAMLLVSPLTENLFHRAIIESISTSGIQNVTLEDAEPKGVAWGTSVGIAAGPDQLEKMKTIPFGDVITNGTFQITSVYIDGQTMDIDTLTGFLEGKNRKVPVIIGSNANEAGFYYLQGSQVPIYPLAYSPGPWQQFLPANTSETYESFVRLIWGDDADEVLSLYPSEEPLKSGQKMSTDTMFTVPTLMIADAMASRGEDVHLYHFDQQPPGSIGETYGAFHGSELPYIGFDTKELPVNPQNTILQDYMSSYWTNFAKTGDPNADGLPQWETLPANTNEWFVLGPDVGTQDISKEMLEQYALVKPQAIGLINQDKFQAELS